jgi:hypothetical protein
VCPFVAAIPDLAENNMITEIVSGLFPSRADAQ